MPYPMKAFYPCPACRQKGIITIDINDETGTLTFLCAECNSKREYNTLIFAEALEHWNNEWLESEVEDDD